MKRNIPVDACLIPTLLFVVGTLALALYPGKAETMPVQTAKNPGAPATGITVRLIETRTIQYVENQVPAVPDRAVTLVEKPDTTTFVFQQPDIVTIDTPGTVDMVVADNKTYRIERLVAP